METLPRECACIVATSSNWQPINTVLLFFSKRSSFRDCDFHLLFPAWWCLKTFWCCYKEALCSPVYFSFVDGKAWQKCYLVTVWTLGRWQENGERWGHMVGDINCETEPNSPPLSRCCYRTQQVGLMFSECLWCLCPFFKKLAPRKKAQGCFHRFLL